LAPIAISTPDSFPNLNLKAYPSLRSLVGVRERQRPTDSSKQVQECEFELLPIPRDVLPLIFQFCSVQDALNGARVCKHWNNALSSSLPLWSYHYNLMIDQNLASNSKKCNKSRLTDCSYEFYKLAVLSSQAQFCRLENAACSRTISHKHIQK
jgi:hypothetical protein